MDDSVTQRPPPVCTGRAYARSGNRLHSLQRSVNSTRFGASSMASFLSNDLPRHDKSRRSREMQNAFDPEVRERRARLLAVRGVTQITDNSRPSGCTRYCDTPFPLGGWSVPACTRVRPTGLYGHQKVGRVHISLLRGLDRFFPVSQSWLPPKSGSRVIPCKTQTNGIALRGCSPSTWFPGFSTFLRP